MQDHVVAARKKDIERISEPKLNAINLKELFGKTPLVEIFPKPKTIITVKETDSLKDALSLIAKNEILSVPVWTKSSRNYSKFIDVLDIVAFIHQHLKNKNITDEQAAILKFEELLSKGDLETATVGQVAGLNSRSNYYVFEHKAPTRAVLDRMCASNLHRVPIIDGEGELYGICSQSDVIHFINVNKNLFMEFWGKTIEELKFELHQVVTIKTSDTVMKAFDLIKTKEISGVGVVDEKGALVGTVSGSDIKIIGAHIENLHKLFLSYTEVLKPNQKALTVVTKSDTFGSLIEKFVTEKHHRVFIVDPNSKAPIGVISLVDFLKKIQSSL